MRMKEKPPVCLVCVGQRVAAGLDRQASPDEFALSQQMIWKVADAAISAHLAGPDKREVLMLWVRPELWATIPLFARPDLQVLVDVFHLSANREALRQWLRVACSLSKERTEHQVFSEALDSLEETPT